MVLCSLLGTLGRPLVHPAILLLLLALLCSVEELVRPHRLIIFFVRVEIVHNGHSVRFRKVLAFILLILLMLVVMLVRRITLEMSGVSEASFEIGIAIGFFLGLS